MIINDDRILLSYLNTKLRDEYDSLLSLVDDLDFDLEEITKRMNGIGYIYNKDINQFIVKENN